MTQDHPDIEIKRRSMNGKPVFEIEVKTIINFETAFIHKKLCTNATFSLGTACVFSCAYCYVEAMVRKHPAVVRLQNELKARGLKFHDVVIVRINALDIFLEQLTNKKPRGVDLQRPEVVYTSPLVDPAGNMAQVRKTAEACLIILELTAWDIRLLSKSALLVEIAKLIPERYKHRLIYGVSTGTLEDPLAAAIEKGTALVSKRIASLHSLQDQGYRTFGMICPSLPQDDYDGFARDMAAAIRVDRCEHVWAEVINVQLLGLLGFVFELSRSAFLGADVIARPEIDGLIDAARFAERVKVPAFDNLTHCGDVVIRRNGDVARRLDLLSREEQE